MFLSETETCCFSVFSVGRHSVCTWGSYGRFPGLSPQSSSHCILLRFAACVCLFLLHFWNLMANCSQFLLTLFQLILHLIHAWPEWWWSSACSIFPQIAVMLNVWIFELWSSNDVRSSALTWLHCSGSTETVKRCKASKVLPSWVCGRGAWAKLQCVWGYLYLPGPSSPVSLCNQSLQWAFMLSSHGSKDCQRWFLLKAALWAAKELEDFSRVLRQNWSYKNVTYCYILCSYYTYPVDACTQTWLTWLFFTKDCWKVGQPKLVPAHCHEGVKVNSIVQPSSHGSHPAMASLRSLSFWMA